MAFFITIAGALGLSALFLKQIGRLLAILEKKLDKKVEDEAEEARKALENEDLAISIKQNIAYRAVLLFDRGMDNFQENREKYLKNAISGLPRKFQTNADTFIKGYIREAEDALGDTDVPKSVEDNGETRVAEEGKQATIVGGVSVSEELSQEDSL